MITRRNLISSILAVVPLAFLPRSAMALSSESVEKSGFKMPDKAAGLWQVLEHATDGTDPGTMITTELPRITPEIRTLAGQEIELKGYMQPVMQTFGSSEYVLSRTPFHCTGCYAGGRASLALVKSSGSNHVADGTNLVTVTGKLVLNETIADDFYFILQEAKITG
jgi:hypothetical protein